MDTQTQEVTYEAAHPEQPLASHGAEPGAPPEANSELWFVAATLIRHRKFIASTTAAFAFASVILALLLPRYYAAEARLVQPEQGSLGMLGGLIGGVPGGLGGLLGGGAEYSRYLTILTSRTLRYDVVDRFDLVSVYELEDEPEARHLAAEVLAENVEFVVDDAFFFLTVRAYDQDAERAADMANFIVDALNEENVRLSSESARQTRSFVERRLHEAESALDSVQAQLQDFQEEYGVVELESQSQAFLQSMAVVQAEVAQAEVQYGALLRQYGPDNPQVQSARLVLEAARSQVRGAMSGNAALLPVALDELPTLGRRYAELMQGQLIQAKIIETVTPLYEQALFQERNDADALQVVDEAVPPLLPARPSRRAVVVLITLSGFMLVALYVLATAWWQRHHEQIAIRLHKARLSEEAASSS